MIININYKHKQKGLSLVELLLIVSLLAIILIGSFVAYNKISETTKITDEIKQVNTLVAGSKIFALSNKYDKLDNLILKNLRVIDDNFITTKGYIKSNLSDGIKVETIYNNKDKTITHMKLSFLNFYSEYCTRFIQGIEKQVDLITVEQRILKNHFDQNHIKDYDLTYTALSCDNLSKNYKYFPLILIIPYGA